MADGKRSRTGIFIVVALVVVGALAAFLAHRYWERVADGTWDDDTPLVVPGIDAPMPPEKKGVDPAVELQLVEENFAKAIKEKNFNKRVVRAAERLVIRYPKLPEARRLLAQVYLFSSDKAKAYEQLLACLAINKQQPEVLMLAGTIGLDLKKPDEAAQHYSAAAALRPDDPAVRTQLASAYTTKRDFAHAETTLLEALRIDSNYHKAYELLCDIYATQGKPKMALDQIQKAIETTPAAMRAAQIGYIRKRTNLLRRDNRPEEALMGLTSSLNTEERSDPNIVEDAARCWAMLGKPDQAAKGFEDAQRRNPGEWRLAEGAARWWIKANNLDAAKRQIEILRRINPRLPELEALEKSMVEAETRPAK